MLVFALSSAPFQPSCTLRDRTPIWQMLHPLPFEQLCNADPTTAPFATFMNIVVVAINPIMTALPARLRTRIFTTLARTPSFELLCARFWKMYKQQQNPDPCFKLSSTSIWLRNNNMASKEATNYVELSNRFRRKLPSRKCGGKIILFIVFNRAKAIVTNSASFKRLLMVRNQLSLTCTCVFLMVVRSSSGEGWALVLAHLKPLQLRACQLVLAQSHKSRSGLAHSLLGLAPTVSGLRS